MPSHESANYLKWRYSRSRHFLCDYGIYRPADQLSFDSLLYLPILQFPLFLICAVLPVMVLPQYPAFPTPDIGLQTRSVITSFRVHYGNHSHHLSQNSPPVNHFAPTFRLRITNPPGRAASLFDSFAFSRRILFNIPLFCSVLGFDFFSQGFISRFDQPYFRKVMLRQESVYFFIQLPRYHRFKNRALALSLCPVPLFVPPAAFPTRRTLFSFHFLSPEYMFRIYTITYFCFRQCFEHSYYLSFLEVPTTACFLLRRLLFLPLGFQFVLDLFQSIRIVSA